MDKFWLVWNGSLHHIPKVQHPTCRSASGEALRLAKENPDQNFYVLESFGHYKKEVVSLTIHTTQKTND